MYDEIPEPGEGRDSKVFSFHIVEKETFALDNPLIGILDMIEFCSNG